MSFETNEAFYDRISESYDAIAHSSERDSTERGLAILAAKESEAVFELGYGTGHALVSLARAVGSEGRVAGLDVSSGMKKVTSHRLEREEVADRVDLRVGAAPPLSYDDGVFDATFLSFTLELFPPDEIDQVVSELHRVTKSGGRCVVVAMAQPRSDREDTALERIYVWMHRHFPHIVDCHPIEVEAT
ncbi:MAG: methyltransferase domain-containing protein, partial [Verrucomicrobiota bacterium]